MSELADEPIPRSDATIERWTSAASRRTERLARNLYIVFSTVGIAAGLLGAVAMLNTRDAPPGYPVYGFLVIALLGGVLPGKAIRAVMRAEIKYIPDIIRNGVAHRAIIAKHDREPMGGTHMLTLRWEEDGKPLNAHFDIAKPDATFVGEITVLVRPKQRLVGAVLGDDGFFLGKRRLIH